LVSIPFHPQMIDHLLPETDQPRSWEEAQLGSKEISWLLAPAAPARQLPDDSIYSSGTFSMAMFFRERPDTSDHSARPQLSLMTPFDRAARRDEKIGALASDHSADTLGVATTRRAVWFTRGRAKASFAPAWSLANMFRSSACALCSSPRPAWSPTSTTAPMTPATRLRFCSCGDNMDMRDCAILAQQPIASYGCDPFRRGPRGQLPVPSPKARSPDDALKAHFESDGMRLVISKDSEELLEPTTARHEI